MSQRILVPLDGSLRAERALSVAAYIACASHSSILLVRVIDVSRDCSWPMVGVSPDLRGAREVARVRAHAYLEEMAQGARVRGLDVTTTTLEGKPAETILSVAQNLKADLMVMSSHGHTGLKRWSLGSVAQVIERRSVTPVLMLRDQVGPSQRLLHGMTKPIRVLVALDGTPLSEAIVPAAAEVSAALSSPLPGALHLAMVVPEPLQEQGRIAGSYTKAIGDAQSYLNWLSKRLRRDPQVGPRVEITSSISLQSNVSEALVKLAEMGAEMEGVSAFTGYDVIAMATHGREGVDRWLSASITEQVLEATQVPVLVMRPEQVEVRVASGTSHDQCEALAVS